ncbi:157_t:CDS:1 [Paraglomus brasilianum]|uniref:157_t:CDS:1 n=1 Tax=Paraglomus brasilianum TaxID=144538 RepID=A0A9N9DYU0_9GLOM|nr:157_t:CDS:1 [Paraglomus brasilianum]
MFQLAQTFHALNKAVVLLQGVYNQGPPQISPTQRSFPYINSFQTLDGQMLEFNYKSKLHGLVFNVERSNDYSCTLPKDLLVKFAQDYGVNAHEACAEMGIAPQLFGCYSVSGGWKVVVMEYMKDDYSNLAEEYYEPSCVDEIKKSVKEKVEKMHAKGFVHGDLRQVNILRQKHNGNIVLVDFDWAGRIHEAKYPLYMNPNLPRHPDATYLGEITTGMVEHLFPKTKAFTQ